MDIPYRTGTGFDAHRFKPGRELWLCGVKIDDAPMGLDGHSDADAPLHALCDAMLGAAGLQDIGSNFPDTDPAYEGVDSKILLRAVAERVLRTGDWRVGNADITVIAQTPRLLPHIPAMRGAVADCLGIDPSNVAVKATTTEHMGFTGRKEGIAALANVLLWRPPKTDTQQ